MKSVERQSHFEVKIHLLPKTITNSDPNSNSCDLAGSLEMVYKAQGLALLATNPCLGNRSAVRWITDLQFRKISNPVCRPGKSFHRCFLNQNLVCKLKRLRQRKKISSGKSKILPASGVSPKTLKLRNCVNKSEKCQWGVVGLKIFQAIWPKIFQAKFA